MHPLITSTHNNYKEQPPTLIPHKTLVLPREKINTTNNLSSITFLLVTYSENVSNLAEMKLEITVYSAN